MKKKDKVLAFALLGLAAGAVTYYLLSTDDGKKKLKKVNSDIKDITKSLQNLSKKESKIACKIAQTAKSGLQNLTKKINKEQTEAVNVAIDSATELKHKLDTK